MSTTTEEARESRLRRAVRRQGYALRKSRSRTPESCSYGGWAILDPTFNAWVAGMHPMEYTLDLDDVETWLNAESAARKRQPE